MAILVVGAAFSSSSGGDGVHWAAFHGALNNVDSAASLCGRVLADNNKGSRCSILFLDFSQDPNGPPSTSRASHTGAIHKTTTLPRRYMSAGATAATRQPERGKLNGKRAGA